MNPRFNLQNVHDPRPAWDAQKPALDQEEARRQEYIAIAEQIGDPELIKLARDHAEDLTSARLAYVPARKLLDEHMFDLAAARTQLVTASAAVAEGTLDREVALRNHANLVAAQAKAAHLGNALPSIAASVDGARVRVSKCAGMSAAREVREETMGFVDKLLNYTVFDAAFTDAEEAGRKSRVAASTWWPIVEQVAIAEFTKRIAPLRADAENTGTRGSDGRFIRGAGREIRSLPTEADLEICFARRRAGFEAERQRLAAQLQAFTGQLQNLEGAR